MIVGGGGHGLATAYYLATRHGITNVAVLEADYIASGNTGRNTTIIRANYAVPEAIRFYDHSMKLYQGLEAETGAAIFHRQKGHVWLAHTEMGMRTERGRCLMNQAMGVRTEMLDAGRGQGADPADRPDRRRPLPGLRRVASRRGGDGPPRSGRLGVRVGRDGARGPRHPAPARDRAAPRRRGRVVGVETAAGPDPGRDRPVGASAAGSPRSPRWPASGCPIRTHPLHAFVTNDFEQGLDKIVASTELACYVSQTERGQMLIGAEFDSQPSFSRISSFDALRSYAYKITMLLPFLRSMRILRTWAGLCDISADWSPIMGDTGVDGFLITTGWGTWGFKAIPAGGEALAERIATGTDARR